MTFYMIRDKRTGLWYTRQPAHSGGWTTQDKAAVWTTKGGAYATMKRRRTWGAFRDCDMEVVTLATISAVGRITFVDGDDWEGLYIDGKLVTEGHRIRIDELLQLLGIQGKQVYADDAWLTERGSLPKNLDEVKKGYHYGD